MPTTTELRQQITNRIVEALESGNLPPWRKPWRCDPNAGMPTNVVSKKQYSGINVLLLESAAMRHNLQSKFWATYRQWSQLGGQVKQRPVKVEPGHWGTQIVFWSPIKKTKIDDTGEEKDERFFIMKSYTVFNVDQVDGPFDHLRVGYGGDTRNDGVEVFADAERAINAIGADIRYGGNRAYYDIAGDYIQMPPRSSFDVPGYHDVLAHELIHWSERRLKWDRKNQGYAMGELIAELGGCFFCSTLGLGVAENLTNHAAYLKNWIDAMKGDPSFIFKASTQASKAVDYLLSFSRRDAGQPEPLIVI